MRYYSLYWFYKHKTCATSLAFKMVVGVFFRYLLWCFDYNYRQILKCMTATKLIKWYWPSSWPSDIGIKWQINWYPFTSYVHIVCTYMASQFHPLFYFWNRSLHLASSNDLKRNGLEQFWSLFMSSNVDVKLCLILGLPIFDVYCKLFLKRTWHARSTILNMWFLLPSTFVIYVYINTSCI